jgi:2-polyprenyl-3-methyl-5-hydroxy-6-metoxy-1,4-benzoquinol methylase
LLFELCCGQLQEIVNSDLILLDNISIHKLLKEELFYLTLQKSLVTNLIFEKLITKLRYEILFTLDKDNTILKEHFNFIMSLAEQSWLNEYVHIISENEINQIKLLKDKIEKDLEINELEISILGCYSPLNSSKIIEDKLKNYTSSNILFNDLIKVQIKEPLKEIELKKTIKSLDLINDEVSKKVQIQYEENPYPRWRYSHTFRSENFLVELNSQIKPNMILHNNKFDNPNVLIAGCGTGGHTMSATAYKNANILGVDLSLTSLSYAKRKTEELGFKNIEFLQADILQLKKLNRKFDIIESVGTLHHMKEPLLGLKVLLELLEPHGFLRLGLYSETARKAIVKARELIRKENFKNTNEDIRICRELIMNKNDDPLFSKISWGVDFYSTSNVRDLLFHVQEHRFTIPEISEILKDFNLEFLGFTFTNKYTRDKFSKTFPTDKKNISLEYWHQFEIDNPNIFAGMYQFWVRKIS